jgi:hypothetical protein
VAVIDDFGADTLLFADDLSDSTSGWGVGTNAGGTVGYVDEALQFDLSSDDSWMWTRRADALRWNVMRVEADVSPSGSGYAGLLCSDDEEELWGAAVTTAGLVQFFELTDAGASILTSVEDLRWAIAEAATTRLVLDCAGTAIGPFRMQLSLPDRGLSVVYDGASGEGDEGFDRASVYAESLSHPYSLRVDNVSVYGGEGETAMSPEAQALLLHVPLAWRPACFESEPSAFETGGLAAVSCTLADGRSDVVDYVQFDSNENMDAAYQARVDQWAVESTASCETGPNEVGYTIGGTPAGRVLCAPQVVGIRVDWTHDDLLILTTLTDFEGSYGDAYQDWLAAGPE